MSADDYENGPEHDEAAEVEALDRAAEAWLIAQHGDDWYIGSATSADWDAAYRAVDPAPGLERET